ncbi:MAG: RNA-binding protein, partial [Janthinobacterium sp.]
MTTPHEMPTVRLAKRLSEDVPCSRREAELYIEGGWVTVDGV